MGFVPALSLRHCRVRLVDFDRPKGDSLFLDRKLVYRKGSSCMGSVVAHGAGCMLRTDLEAEL